MAGTVQDANTGRVTPFQTPEELWFAIAGASRSTPRRTGAGRTETGARVRKSTEQGGGNEDN